MSCTHLTQEKLKKLLRYDEVSGSFTWLVRPARNVMVGAVAGCLTKTGYVTIKIEKKDYKAHRLAWLYVYGVFPSAALDHVNRVRSDCRIENLREATPAQNNFNRAVLPNSGTGVKGVYRSGQKWIARCSDDGQEKYLGTFETLEEAKRAREAYAKDLHGPFFYAGDLGAML